MKRLVFLLMWLFSSMLSAQVVHDSVTIYFRIGRHKLDSTFRSNTQMLDRLNSPTLRLEKVEVVGAASPEGSVQLNQRLSRKRGNVLYHRLSRMANLNGVPRIDRFLGRDWRGLLRLVETDPKVPYRQESLELLREILREVESGEPTSADPFWRLVALRGGEPYRYMYRNLFPALRRSEIHLWFRKIFSPVPPAPLVLAKELPAWEPLQPVPLSAPAPKPTSVFWAIKTNALYDLLAVPNIGAEVYWGKDWSVGANWMYGWWKHDHKHWYWRIYGGDLYARKWFGRKAKEKPLTGHHVGVYAQMLTYDFATGGRGYMGGQPGGNLWDKASYAVGVEYGYSHPISRRLNLDFTLGVGYLTGDYHEYLPQGDCYVWQATKKRNWIGPTKAEVSLVWLMGRGNYNKQKGGRR